MQKAFSLKTKALCVSSRFLWNAKLCLMCKLMWLTKISGKKDWYFKRNEALEHSVLQSRLLPLPYSKSNTTFIIQESIFSRTAAGS